MAENQQGTGSGPPELRRASSIRRVVARKMTEAWRTIPAVTLHRSVQFDGLLEARKRLNDSGHKVAIDTLLGKLAAQALVEYELLNGSWVEEEWAVRVHPTRNVAVAVDTPGGLSAVVLRAADQRSITELDADLRAMVERARAGRSRPEDVLDATFTLTNLGGLGVDAFSPIITPPQSAVLGVGALHAESGGERSATLSLTFDHRVVDGADAARFLGRLADLIRDPDVRGPEFDVDYRDMVSGQPVDH